MPQLHDALVFEFPVSPHDGIRIHDEFLCESADRRKLISGTQGAYFDCVLDLLHQLKVERNARRGIQAKERHALCASSLSQYTIWDKCVNHLDSFHQAALFKALRLCFLGGFALGSSNTDIAHNFH